MPANNDGESNVSIGGKPLPGVKAFNLSPVAFASKYGPSPLAGAFKLAAYQQAFIDNTHKFAVGYTMLDSFVESMKLSADLDQAIGDYHRRRRAHLRRLADLN